MWYSFQFQAIFLGFPFIFFVTSNHQTTNFVFPNVFHEFFSVLAVEKENKLFYGLKQNFFFLSFEPVES